MKPRNLEQIDMSVRDGLHGCGCRSVERFTTQTGTSIWSCDKTTVFFWAGDRHLTRLSDVELADYIVRTLRYRLEKGIF